MATNLPSTPEAQNLIAQIFQAIMGGSRSTDTQTPIAAATGAATGTPPVTGAKVPELTGWQKFSGAAEGIGALGSLWGSIQQNKIAKEQLNLSRENYNTNMNNTIKSYNTSLEDRVRSAYRVSGRSSEDADAYVERNRLSR